MNLYSKLIIPQASLALESSLNSYTTGKLDFLSVLSNFSTILENEMKYYETQAQLLKAISPYRNLQASRFPDETMKNFVLGFFLAAILFGGSLVAYRHWSGRGCMDNRREAGSSVSLPDASDVYLRQTGQVPNMRHGLGPDRPEQDCRARAAGPAREGSRLRAGRDSRRAIESMGITLAEARRTELDQSIRTYGEVAYDETRIHHVHTKFEGFIETMYADYVGQYVRRGDPLFSIYSPDLYATENEYLLALKSRDQVRLLPKNDANFTIPNIDLVAAAQQRLALWDIGENEIREIERTRKPIRALTITAPVSGYVTAKTALHGLKVSPADDLYDIVDLSTVWILADIYEGTLPFVTVGQPVSVTSPYRPGRTWHGRVAFINPSVDPATRTVKARLEFPNPNGELKPDMYADIVIGGARGNGIAVPESAVISTGERNIVFVAAGKGVFEPREVILGVRVKNFYEIKKGVSEGEKGGYRGQLPPGF